MKTRNTLIVLFTMLLSMISLSASAHDIEVANEDGKTIYYVWTNNNTELGVSYKGALYSSVSNEYSGNVVIPDIVTYNDVVYPVTSIEQNAFENCSGLTSITIPSSVTSIEQKAFENCSGLTSVECSDLSAWCNIQFSDGSSNPLSYAHHLYVNGEIINDLVIPNSVTSINNYAFYNCSGLTSVTIPSSVISIGQSAFNFCSGLTSVTIPNSVTSIGEQAFSGCSGLMSVTIPNSVTNISYGTFYGCSGLTSVTIPNSVTSIGQSAFSGCSGLTSVAIPNSVTSIGESAFSGCSGLTSVTIPNSVTSIGHSAFYKCSGLTSVTIPSSVTSIGNNAYTNCSGLTSITIPNSVTTIGNNAFSGCSSLTSITIPNSVTSIASAVFYECSGLTSVTIPNSVTTIGKWAFQYCSSLTSIDIPNSVTTIVDQAFSGCSSLTSVTIPSSVTSIGSSVFSGCSSLTEICVDDNNTKYCSLDGVLMNKSQTSVIAIPGARESYVLPVSVTSLNPSILGSNIKSFQIADSDTPLTLTGGNFSNLDYIYIGRNITLSSSYSFSGPFPSSVVIKLAEFGNRVTNIAQKLFYWSHLQSVTIPLSVTTINTDAFKNCSYLKKVNYLGTIDQWLGITFSNNPLHNGADFYLNGSPVSNLTFANIDGTVGTQLRGCTNLKSVTIASGNTVIEQDAFSGCVSLETITIPKSVVTINSSAFYNCNNLKAVYYNGTLGNWYAMTLASNPITLGAGLYLNNTLLTNAVIPSSVTQIGTQLRGCTSLETVTISSGVTAISAYAFENCKSLTSVTVPSGVTSIGNYAFGYCVSLTGITIPSSVTDLSNYAFYGCSSLQYINFSGSSNYTTIDGVVYDKDVTKIISYPQGKTSTSYTYPSTITTFGGISNNPYLERIIVPALSTSPSITPFSFNAGPNLISVEFEDSIKTSSYSYFTREGVVYSYYTYNNNEFICLVFCPRGKTSLTVTPDVTSLYVNGFSGESKLQSLMVESSDRSLSFSDYNSSGSSLSTYFHSPLSEVYLGREISVSSSIYYLFASNPDLETVVIGENMTSIPSRLFNGCTGLTQVTLPETITSVGQNAFTGTPWLESLPMQDGVRYHNHIALKYDFSEETKNVRLKEGTSVIASGLFENSNVESVEFPISVTSLQSQLFYGCNRLKKVVLPNSIITIPDYMYCGALDNIHVPGSVTWIGRYAIWDCDTVVIEDGNNAVSLNDRNADDGYYPGVFSNVKNLYVGCNMDNGAFSYAGETFSPYPKLTDLTFGPLVTKAFTGYDLRGCDQVKSVTCLAKQPFTSPDFYYQICQTAILYVPLGSGDSYASASGWSSFSSIEEVTSVTITMDDTEKIYAGDFDLDFSAVEGLKAYVVGDYDSETSTITLVPAHLVSAGKGVILKGAKGTYTVPCANIEPTTDDPLCGTISGRFIRNTEDGNINYTFDKNERVFKRVDAIYGCLLSRNEAYLSLPASSASNEIVKIEFYSPAITFADDNVKAICVANWDTNGDGELSEAEAAAVTSLGTVFKDNMTITSFDELQYFTGLTEIGNSAFNYCEGLTSIILPESVTHIGSQAFYFCSNLASVVIPESVTSIGDYAFRACRRLTNVTLPNSLTSIDYCAFYDCSGLTSLTIPYSVTSIGSNAFFGCSGLSSVTIPSSLTSIGGAAFAFCSGLTSISVNSGNDKYDSRNECNAIIETATNTLIAGCKNTAIPNSVTSIDLAFYGCSGLTSILIPNSVTNIGNSAFANSGLTSLTIPNSVTTIGNAAFCWCSNLTSVIIPESVTYIHELAFNGCSGLTSVKVDVVNPLSIGTFTFSNRANATLYVPVGSKAAYEAADYWKEFKEIIEFLEGDVNGDGESDVLDVVDIARYVVGTPAETFVLILADINNNGEVNIADAVCLVNDIAGDQNFAKPNRAPKHNAANETLLLTTDNENYLSLALQNERFYTAFQFDLYVPDGTDVTQMLLNAQRKQKHQLLYNKVEDGHWRVAALSTSNRTFNGNDGELLRVVYDGIMNDEVAIRNIHFFTADGSDYQFDDISLGGTTAIHSLNNGQGTNVGPSTVYDMQGRKIMSGDSSNRQLPKGLYIINGKKVVIK